MFTQPVYDVACPSCLQNLKESKWTDVILMASSVVLLILGILASNGLFDSMGTAD